MIMSLKDLKKRSNIILHSKIIRSLKNVFPLSNLYKDCQKNCQDIDLSVSLKDSYWNMLIGESKVF